MPKGWRPPSLKYLREKAASARSSMYPCYHLDILENICFSEGKKVGALSPEEEEIKNIIQ